MSLNTIQLGGTTKKNIEDINENFTALEQAISQAGGGDMTKLTYDTNDDGIVNAADTATTATTADKVGNSLTIKFDTGTSEGNDKYTFDGSGAKTIDIQADSNIAITNPSAGVIKIAATDTDTITSISTGASPTVSSTPATGSVVLGAAAAKQVATSIPANPTADDNAALPILEAVKGYVDSKTTGLLSYQDTIAGGSTGDYGSLTPAAKEGYFYVVSTAGKINGVNVEPFDALICKVNTAAATSSDYATIINNWNIVQGNIDGAVKFTGTAPTSGQVAVFNDATGTFVATSGHTLEADVPSGAVFTDTVPIKTTFDNSTYWSANATNGVYTLTLTIDSGRYPVAVFNSSGAQVMVGLNLASATSVTVESYSKFAGYVILV